MSERASVTQQVAAAVAVAGNVLAVVALHEIPSAYRVARIESWAREVQAAPALAAASAALFTVGLVALAVWAQLCRERARSLEARTGFLVIALGAMLNAAGTLAPMVVGFHLGLDAASLPVARGLLGLSLALDAHFNFALFVGLGLVAVTSDVPRRLRWLAGAAALASAPVAAQVVWDPAANLLLVSAPLWLAFIVASAFGRASAGRELGVTHA